MKFIFPKNYNFKYKLFGFMDCTTAILDIIIGFILFEFVHLFISNITIKIYIFIIVFLPIFLFSIFGLQKENLLYVLLYIFKFIKNRNIYLYKKISNNKS